MNQEFVKRFLAYKTGLVKDGQREKADGLLLINEVVGNYKHVSSEYLKLHSESKENIQILMDAIHDTVQIIETVFNDTGKIIDFEDQILKRLQKAVKAVNDKL